MQSKLTDRHIEEMKHAIGLDYCRSKPYTRHGKKFYRPYRNYFNTNVNSRVWMEIEEAGLATHGKVGRNDNTYYWLTRAGLDWLGEKLGIHIYDEEE